VVGDIALSQTREVIERILDSIKYWELLLWKTCLILRNWDHSQMSSVFYVGDEQNNKSL
jgi:hypothetical protein